MPDTPEDNAPDAAASTDAAALSLALNAAAHDGKVAARAAIFLDEQTKLVRLQAEDLRKEDVLRHWSLRVRHINDLLKLAFGLGAAFVALMVAVGLVALAWNAHAATGLLIQPIKAPPDFAQRGLDGTVLAQRLLDKLNGLVRTADKWSFRAADSIGGNWGDNSKVEIPETGISVFELQRFLRQSLGHETIMSGELYRTSSGIALTVRVGADTGTTFEGRDQDIDALLSRAAEALLVRTQPYRYVFLLYAQGRPAPVIAPIARNLADTATGSDRIWLRSAYAEQLSFAGRFREANAVEAQTIAAAPEFPSGPFDMAPSQWAVGHLQAAYDNAAAARRIIRRGVPADFRADVAPLFEANIGSFADDIAGAYGDAIRDDKAQLQTVGFDIDVSGPLALANDYALDHDIAAAQAVLARHHLLSDGTLLSAEYIITTGPDLPNFYIRAERNDWAGASDALGEADRAALARGNVNDVRHTLVWPWLAYSWARTGRLQAAHDLIARTPQDCTLCLEMRGRIAEIGQDWRGAAFWFDRAIRDAPSLPFAETDWGTMQLRRHDYDGAIAHYEMAHVKSPHFADPLELWGEALIAQNRSDLAIPKFEEAARYAPNWGRLHFKWGEALLWLGREDDAQKQFALAASLDLVPADRATLARMRTSQ
jgi:tetratricopeptide (TPR) repeat protein